MCLGDNNSSDKLAILPSLLDYWPVVGRGSKLVGHDSQLVHGSKLVGHASQLVGSDSKFVGPDFESPFPAKRCGCRDTTLSSADPK